MRLDRFVGETGGKYSIIENRNGGRVVHIEDPVDDFFVIKLKDVNAEAALVAYARQAALTDPALAADVLKLSERAGPNHPSCKRPD